MPRCLSEAALVDPVPLEVAANDDDETLAFARRMAALAKRGGDAPETLTHEEIQELCLTLEIYYAQMGVS